MHMNAVWQSLCALLKISAYYQNSRNFALLFYYSVAVKGYQIQ